MKKPRLLYLPVERYNSRWTAYVSGEDGMFAHCMYDADRADLEVIAPDNELKTIKSGVVLDTQTRASWSFWQVSRLLAMIDAGDITDSDVIYLEDFWLPGMEMIPYACHLKGIKPKVYAFWHAQSVNLDDFTFGMLPWIRDFEIGFASWLTGIFVAAKELKEMMLAPEDGTRPICPAEKIHVIGTVFRRQDLMQYLPILAGEPEKARRPKRRQHIVFASRFDKEKDPDFFCQFANRCGYPLDVVSGRSIPEPYRTQLFQMEGVYLHENVAKDQYFQLLAGANVSFNCAKQDFVGYCQLDALAMGCHILMPNRLTFPDLVGNNAMYLYEPGNLDDAVRKLNTIMNTGIAPNLAGDEPPEIYQRFGSKYERSVARMLDVMFAERSLGSIIMRERLREYKLQQGVKAQDENSHSGV
jgi:hypothetical protein